MRRSLKASDVERAFRIYRVASGRSLKYSRDICLACEQDERIKETQRARWKSKAEWEKLDGLAAMGNIPPEWASYAES